MRDQRDLKDLTIHDVQPMLTKNAATLTGSTPMEAWFPRRATTLRLGGSTLPGRESARERDGEKESEREREDIMYLIYIRREREKERER